MVVLTRITAALLMVTMAGCGAVSESLRTEPVLVSITVSPQFLCRGGTLPVQVGAPSEFSATGFFDNGTRQDNLPVTWSVSDANVATIEASGTPACQSKGVEGRVTVFATAPAWPGASQKVSGTAAFGCGGRFCP